MINLLLEMEETSWTMPRREASTDRPLYIILDRDGHLIYSIYKRMRVALP